MPSVVKRLLSNPSLRHFKGLLKEEVLNTPQVPPIPRLLPSWEQLQALAAPEEAQPLAVSESTSTSSTYLLAAGAGAGFAVGLAGVALVVGFATRRKDQGTKSRVQIRRGPAGQM